VGRRCDPPSISLTLLTVLRCLAGSLGLGTLGFERLFGAHVDFDLLGLGFGLLRQVDLQYALVVVGADLSCVHGTGESERAGEASVLPLNPTEALLPFSSFSILRSPWTVRVLLSMRTSMSF
jgi:hypothetical protein